MTEEEERSPEEIQRRQYAINHLKSLIMELDRAMHQLRQTREYFQTELKHLEGTPWGK